MIDGFSFMTIYSTFMPAVANYFCQAQKWKNQPEDNSNQNTRFVFLQSCMPNQAEV